MKEGLREERQGGWGGVTTVMAGGPNEQPNLLARQLVNTMYEVTVSSVDTVGLL